MLYIECVCVESAAITGYDIFVLEHILLVFSASIAIGTVGVANVIAEGGGG